MTQAYRQLFIRHEEVVVDSSLYTDCHLSSRLRMMPLMYNGEGVATWRSSRRITPSRLRVPPQPTQNPIPQYSPTRNTYTQGFYLLTSFFFLFFSQRSCQ
jgi:hypothetical protein